MQFNNTMSVLSIMLVRHYIQTGNKLKEKLNHYMCGSALMESGYTISETKPTWSCLKLPPLSSYETFQPLWYALFHNDNAQIDVWRSTEWLVWMNWNMCYSHRIFFSYVTVVRLDWHLVSLDSRAQKHTLLLSFFFFFFCLKTANEAISLGRTDFHSSSKVPKTDDKCQVLKLYVFSSSGYSPGY